MNRLIFRKPGEAHETLNMIGEQFTVLAAGEDTGSYEDFIQVVPRAPVGTFVHFPAGRPNTFTSRSGTSTILSFTSRPGAAAFFRESNRVNADFPGDLEKLFAVPARHGVRLHDRATQ
jgi:hypothetical protein